MDFDFFDFFDACDPTRTLVISNPDDQKYYIDFAAVRGGKLIESLERTILLKARREQPSCQLFTGHIGCGKSTELRRLQADLEARDFHVVYFESTEDLDMADVDVTDILLAIIRQTSESLEKVNIALKPGYFKNLFNEVADLLETPIEFSYKNDFSLPIGLGKITAQTKESPNLRSRLRQYLEPRTKGILEALNEQVLGRASEKLKQQGKKGLVVIVDNLDRVDNRRTMHNRTQPEYLFVDRGEQLRQLNCHVVYTIPLVLTFSNEYQALTNRFGGGIAPQRLPMVPVTYRTGQLCSEGMILLKQMILVRAFPEIPAEDRLSYISKIFDHPDTLDRLCHISGGHVRNLLGMLYRCLQDSDPPISRPGLEKVIRDHRDSLVLSITDDEWELLRRVDRLQGVSGEDGHQTLLRSLFVFEYQDSDGLWFNVSPVLKESDKFRSLKLGS